LVTSESISSLVTPATRSTAVLNPSSFACEGFV